MSGLSAPPTAPHEHEAERGGLCPTCGSPYEAYQEYCLECGNRLPVNRGLVGVLASGWQRRFSWYPGDWIWPALALLALAAVATVLAVVLGGDNGSQSGSPVVATNVSVPLGPGHVSSPVPTITTATAPLPTAPEATVPEQPPARPRPRPGLATWPAGRSGYTVVLESIPTASGRAAALQRAKEARTRGLRQVGVLDSANFSSFHPGFYVVFAGIYGSYTDASAALGNAHSHGFPDAYPRQVTR
jgi:hypothetical protein